MSANLARIDCDRGRAGGASPEKGRYEEIVAGERVKEEANDASVRESCRHSMWLHKTAAAQSLPASVMDLAHS